MFNFYVNVKICTECHTPMEKGQRIAGMEYAGGMEFPFPEGGLVRSANITPDRETGIGGWTRETFVGVFKASATAQARRERVEQGDLQTVMPWTMYGGMTEKDLGAIYTYLRTVEPVRNTVETHPEP